MLQTKGAVDKHVRSFLSKLQNDEEKNLRGQRIAALYYNIGEYSTALEYIQRYIKVNDTNAAAYKMLGQCYEKLKCPDKQLFAYQRSLEIDKKQPDLLVEVCKLLQNTELTGVTPAKARYWYELAESRGIKVPDATAANTSGSGTNTGKGKSKGSRKQHRNETQPHNRSDSFVSANGRSDLDDSLLDVGVDSGAGAAAAAVHHARHYRHEYHDDANDAATPIPQNNFNNIERLCQQMMESLNILKEDVAEVRNRVQNIEERLNERSISDDDDEEDDIEDGLGLMDDFADVQRNQQHNLNNTSMLANVSSRNQTMNHPTPKSSMQPSKLQQMNTANELNLLQMRRKQQQQQQQQRQQEAAAHSMSAAFHGGGQGSMVSPNPYLLPPMMNNLYGTLPTMNPYQAPLPAAAASNFPYGDLYSLQQQSIIAQQLMNSDPRAGLAMMGMLLQQQQQQPQHSPQLPVHSMQQPMPVPQSYSMMTNALGLPVAVTVASPMAANPITSSFAAAGATAGQSKLDLNAGFQQMTTQTPPQSQSQPQPKQWNQIIKNAPVEKNLPVNVVITSSDPVPQNLTTITTAPSVNFSVTIPPQHIKNNPAAVATTAPQISFGAAFSNPSIVAALQDKKSTTSTFSASAATPPIPAVASSTPSAQEQKSIFGSGFAKPASSTPIASPMNKSTLDGQKSADTPKPADPTAAAAKPSPFASFSFGGGSAANVASSASFTLGGSSQSQPRFSFGNIGQSTSSSLLASVATPETPSATVTTANTSAGSVREPDEEDNINFKPTAHFEPVIELPALVEVKTGEENETVLFEHRAKLLRYVKESKEWKERGIGNMKIMAQKDDPNKVRLLMRREQVLKICCNQMLTKDMKFNKMPKTETTLTWFGQDYSENELQVQMLAIRFKTAETCKQFHDAILAAQAKMGNDTGKPAEVTTTTTAIKSTASKETTAIATGSTKSNAFSGFGDKFKPKTGSWPCEMCYVVNSAADKKCLSCGNAKDKTAPVENIAAKPARQPAFTFGTLNNAAKPADEKKTTTTAGKPSLAEQFKPKPGAWSCKACYTSNTADVMYCACCEEPKDETVPKKGQTNNLFTSNANAPKFNFGTLDTASQSAIAVTTSPSSTTSTMSTGSSTNVSFGSPSFSFSFGSQQNVTNQPSIGLNPNDSGVPKLSETKEFGFVFQPHVPQSSSASAAATTAGAATHNDGVEDVSDDENVEEESTAHFEPVIALPALVDVKTGEENEDVLYSHRAKLFRFRNGEWRERGLGDVKILRHQTNGKLRVLMRRDQIHKICLNHLLTPDIEYNAKDPKSWQFIANDYSEGTFELDNFCLRFKTEDIAKEFKKAIDDIRGNGTEVGTSSQSTTNAITTTTTTTTTASNITADEQKNITSLKMDNNFYDYKVKEDCPGCRGCSDDFVFREVKDTNFGRIDDNPLPLNPPPKVDMSQHNDLSKDTKKSNQPNPFSFNSGSDNGFSFGAAIAAATASAKPNTTPQSGMFFGNDSFKFVSSGGGIGGIDGDSKDANNSSQNLFGGNVAKTASSSTTSAETVKPSFSFNSSSVFGGSKSAEEKSPFALTTTTPPSSNAQEKSESKPFFGTSATFGSPGVIKTPITNIFGGNTNGDDNKSTDTQAPSTGFSFKLPSSTTMTVTSTTKDSPVLSTPTDTSTPITEPPAAPVFGGVTAMSFADLAKNPSNANTDTNTNTGGLSFAALAQNSTNGSTPAFSRPVESGEFIGLTTRDTFSNLMRPQNVVNGAGNATNNDNNADDKNENAAHDDANYDPHYDPIIALPDEIQVSTGEENEIKIFGERAKLYRYDFENKEWKERGVGEFKILHHPGNNSYRLLLRREQIHKLVLNMALTGDIKISPMKQSDKAFIWVGPNYAENASGEGETESLSVRFKNADLANKFNDVVQRCISDLKARE